MDNTKKHLTIFSFPSGDTVIWSRKFSKWRQELSPSHSSLKKYFVGCCGFCGCNGLILGWKESRCNERSIIIFRSLLDPQHKANIRRRKDVSLFSRDTTQTKHHKTMSLLSRVSFFCDRRFFCMFRNWHRA